MPRFIPPGRRLLPAVAALVLGSALLVGCGGRSSTEPNTDVSGSVKFASGEPLPGGELWLFYDDGKSQSVNVGADGTFRGHGVPTGKAKVTFDNSHEPKQIGGTGSPANMPEEFRKKMKQQGAELLSQSPVKWVPVPSRYADAKTTPWTWEITTGQNTKDFVIDNKK